LPATEKQRLTKRTIEAIPAPSGTQRIVIHDTDVKGFSIRVSRGARTFYLYRWIGGRPQRIRLGAYPELAPEAARRLAEKLNGEAAQGKDLAAERRQRRQPSKTDPTMGELLTHTVEHHWKPRCRTWAHIERLFEANTPKWKSRRLSSFTKLDILEMHRKLGKNNGPYLANRWRAVIHRLFEVANEDFDFPGGNPVRKVRRFPEQERERFVTPDELPRLFDAIDSADRQIADFLRLALLTGARKTAIMRMKYADVDLGRAVWSIGRDDSKNKAPIHIPLVPEAVEVIRARLADANGCEYVFPGKGGVGPVKDIRKPLAKVFEVAGFKDVRLHDLRRTFGSWQAAQGSSELLIGKSLGHKNTRSTAVYARLTLDPVRESVERATRAMRQVVEADRAKRTKDQQKGPGNS
jgi:integrase